MRRSLIHHKQTTKVKSLASMAGKAHLHTCSVRQCLAVYEDACKKPEVNGRCQACRNGRVPLWIAARQAQPCCRGNTEQVTDKAEIRRYSLAGPGPWFQCRTCARVHGWAFAKLKGDHIG